MEDTTRTITDIIKELALITLGNDVIIETLDGFNPVLSSTTAQKNVEESNAFMDLMSTSIFNIDEGIGRVLSFFTGRELQEEENRRELLAALARIGDGQISPNNDLPVAENKETIPRWLMSLGKITAFGASLGAISGFIDEMTSSRGIIWKLRVRIRWFMMKVPKMLDNMDDSFGVITTKLQTLFENNRYTKPLADIVKFVRSSVKLRGNFLKSASKALIKVKDSFILLGKSFTWGAKLGKLLGKLLKVFGYVITIAIAAYATISGAITGWKVGGMIGALEGAISGLLVNLAGEVLDLLKDVVSWVAKMLGFEKFSKILDSFSFSELISSGVKAIFDVLQYTWDYLVTLFSPGKLIQSFKDGGFAGLTAMISGGILDMIKGAISWIATMLGEFDFANALDGFSIQKYLMKGVESMIRFVTASINFIDKLWSKAMISKTIVSAANIIITRVSDSVIRFVTRIIDSIVSFFTKAPSAITNMMKSASGKASESMKNVLPDASKHKSPADPLHWVGKAIPKEVYKFAGARDPEQIKNDLNQGGVNPYDEKGREMQGRDAKFASEVLKVQDYLKSSPSNVGATLNQSSSNVRNAPVTINNMGGNVTNNTSSNVSNSSSPFEPLVLGSSMGFTSF